MNKILDHIPIFFKIKLDKNKNLVLCKELTNVSNINLIDDTDLYIKTLLEEVDVLLKIGKHTHI